MMSHRAAVIGLIVIGILALGLGLGLGEWLFRRTATLAPEIAGIYLRDFEFAEDFNLIRQDGQPFTRRNLQGQWTFLYFGYSYCPDVCPLTLGELDRLQKLLAQRGADTNTAYVFISVDPQRDTPERLRDYVRYFNPKFQAATGALEELDRLAKPLRVFYQRGAAAENTGHYTVDHTSTVILIDPSGRPRAIFTPPQQPERMAEDFLKIRAATP
jgi:protein SCO1/2